jgi:type I restriction enzyme S subunit
MKLETFYEKFDLFADAPDAVAKIRELVLELAVQGGLVQNSPNEEAVPYESIEDVTPINAIEFPANWRVVLLADAIKNRSGNSKLIKGKLHEEPAPGRFQGFSASGADVWCDDYEHEGQAIIVSAVGARCGKAFKASGNWSAIANTNITRPEPSLFDFDFAYLVLNNEHFWVRGGSAQPFVKFPPSLDRHFALPPLAEQKRIVAKVDELMAWCDQLEAQRQEREQQGRALARAALARFADAPTPANLEVLFHPSFSIPPSDLRKSILTLAVQGKLVPQDPSDELQTLPPSDQSEHAPHDNPSNWQWVDLAALAQFINGDRSKNYPSKSFRVAAGVPFINAGHLTGGDVSLEEMDYITEEHFERLGGGKVERGDVLYCLRGSLGKCAIVSSISRGAIASSLLIIRPKETVLASFLYAYLLSPLGALMIAKYDNGSAQPNLSAANVKRYLLPLPPLAEQRRIVAKVDELVALVDALETQLATARTTAANLLAALVAELTATR